MRTDLVFARNLDELRHYRRRRGKWGIALVLLLLLAGGGAWGYVRYFRDDPQAALQRLLPWLRSKGRALAGQESLRPLLAVIGRSELTPEEQAACTNYLAEVWTFAENTGGEIVSREDVINEARRVVESRAGLFYALEWVADRDLSRIRLTEIEKKAAGPVFREAAEAVRKGQVSSDAVGRLRADVHVAMLELGAGRDSQSGGGGGEADAPRFRALLATARTVGGAARAASGGGTPVDIPAEFRKAIEALRIGLEGKKQQGMKG